mgnify:CR=1 FL=1
MFQSLSRDSGRLNSGLKGNSRDCAGVSIPQSGFGAFEPERGVPFGSTMVLFQSLSRDSGRLNSA